MSGVVRDRGVPLEGAAARVRRGLPAPVRRGAMGLLWDWNELTTARRVLPDFLIIGTKRGGTSTLYAHLREHPQVTVPFPPGGRFKGTYFFDRNHHRGPVWYRSHFPLRWSVERRSERLGVRVVVGEACPYYLAHPDVPGRVAELLPRARLIVLLREPVARAFSHYRANRRRGIEDLDFVEALAAEPARLAAARSSMVAHPSGYSATHEHLSYRAQGVYADLLPAWFARFPREQMLVLRSEELYRDAAGVLGRVTEFLGLAHFHDLPQRRVNAAPRGEFRPPPAWFRDSFVEANERLGQLIGTQSLWPAEAGE